MNKYGEVYSYVIHRLDNVRPILEALFAAGFEWTGGGKALKHFDCHLVISEMSCGSRFVSISDNYAKCINHYKRTPLNKLAFTQWFNSMAFGTQCDISQCTYEINANELCEAMQYVPTNAMYPIVVTWQSQTYHFAAKHEVYEYFEDTLGYKVLNK